jgi:hypothetical protein
MSRKPLIPLLTAVVLAPAAFALSAGGAFAQNNYTCMQFVTWETLNGTTVVQTGFNPMEPPMTGTGPNAGGGEPVGGATIELAASECHEKTRTTFMNNLAWSDPYQICMSQNGAADKFGRKFTGETRTIWVIDRFKEISETPQLYNRVLGYTVTCTAPPGQAGVVVTFTPINALAGGVKPF